MVMKACFLYGALGLLALVCVAIICLPLLRCNAVVFASERDLDLDQTCNNMTTTSVFVEPASVWSIISVVAFVLLAAGILYWHFGGSEKQLIYWRSKVQSADVSRQLSHKTAEQIINELRQVVYTHPNKAKGWYLLGNLNSDQHHYQAAEIDYAHAVKLQSANVTYALAWLNTVYTNHRRLTDSQVSELNFILSAQPNNVQAINLLAIDAYQTHHYRDAIHYWEEGLHQVDPHSKDAQLLLLMVAKAQMMLKSDS